MERWDGDRRHEGAEHADAHGGLRAAIDEALDHWSLDAERVEALDAGGVNEHWRVRAEERDFVLRRYHPAHAPEAAPYEHDLLRFLAARDWPVAPPLEQDHGGEVAVTDEGRWALFPFLPGEPPPREPLYLQRKGAVLALLHADLQEWEHHEQRPTFARVAELDVYLEPHGFRGVDGLLDWLAGFDAPRAEALRGLRERNLRELDRLDYWSLPDMVIHNECFGANVLFHGDTVTAILDFDFAHRDARVADIGRSLLVDCDGEPLLVFRWLSGYAAHADPRLTAVEIDLLPAMLVANELWNVLVPLAMAREHREPLAPWMRESIDERLPALEAGALDVLRMARQAATPRPR